MCRKRSCLVGCEELTSKILAKDLLRRAAYGIWKKRIANRLEKSGNGKKSKAQKYGVIDGQRPAQDVSQANELFLCLLTLTMLSTCNERKQPKKVTVKSEYKDHSKNKISKPKGTLHKAHKHPLNSLQTHNKDQYNSMKRSKSGKKERKVPHTQVK